MTIQADPLAKQEKDFYNVEKRGRIPGMEHTMKCDYCKIHYEESEGVCPNCGMTPRKRSIKIFMCGCGSNILDGVDFYYSLCVSGS